VLRINLLATVKAALIAVSIAAPGSIFRCSGVLKK
jgi:hypothetical protein